MNRFGFFSQVQINERASIGLVGSLTLISLLSLFAFVAPAGAQEQSRNFQLRGSSNITSPEVQSEDGEHTHPLISYSNTPNLDFTFCTISQLTTNGECNGEHPQSGVTIGSPTGPFPNYLFGTNLSPNVSIYCPIPGGTTPEDIVQNEPGGEVYEVDPSGTWQVLHMFNAFAEPNNSDGFYPVGGLVFDGSNNLWGTTCRGGVYDLGTVFELSPPAQAGNPWTYSYYSLGTNPSDGANPVASLFYDSVNNVLWGTTENGGVNGFGTIFEITNLSAGPSSESPMYAFQGAPTDGAYPLGGIVQDPYAASPLFYGTTQQGGAVQSGNGYGTLFQYIPSSNHPVSLLHSFAGTDGYYPAAGVIAIKDPTITNQTDIYGTTEFGGQFGGGVVFAAIQGSWSGLVYAFGTNPNDGVNPVSSLVALNYPSTSADIYLYGTTMVGGTLADCNSSYGCGTAFGLQSSPTWNESQLIPLCTNYNAPCGVTPLAGLAADSSSNLWGTTEFGGGVGSGQYPVGAGTIFELYCSSSPCPPHILSKFLKWGDVTEGGVGAQMFAKFVNSSDQSVQIGEITVTGEFAFAKPKSGACSGTLAAGATCVVGATFNPTQTGRLTGGLAITLSGQDSPITLFLTGTGVK
jgi:uncharacterized repeat protein (TIGR03803 family)